jgi:hypothetical protein
LILRVQQAGGITEKKLRGEKSDGRRNQLKSTFNSRGKSRPSSCKKKNVCCHVCLELPEEGNWEINYGKQEETKAVSWSHKQRFRVKICRKSVANIAQ